MEMLTGIERVGMGIGNIEGIGWGRE